MQSERDRERECVWPRDTTESSVGVRRVDREQNTMIAILFQSSISIPDVPLLAEALIVAGQVLSVKF